MEKQDVINLLEGLRREGKNSCDLVGHDYAKGATKTERWYASESADSSVVVHTKFVCTRCGKVIET